MIGFIGMLLGAFAIAEMQLVFAGILPQIVNEIGSSDHYGLVFTSYLIASLATIPIFSRLADYYGKKLFYMVGMSIFALGSLLGGFSHHLVPLIMARCVQGVGAGMITPILLAMISDMFSEEKRGRMIGVFGFVQLLANLVSPLLGSLLTQHFGWHSIFFMTIILVIFSGGIVVTANLSQSKSPVKLSEIDLLGGVLFGGACVLAVCFFEMMSKPPKESFVIVLTLVAAFIVVILFVFNEKRQSSPIIKMEFFTMRPLRRALVSALLSGAVMYGFILLLPLCAETLYHGNAVNGGSLLLLFFMIGLSMGLLTASSLIKDQSRGMIRKSLWVTMLVSAVGMLYFMQIKNLSIFTILTVGIGFGIGGTMSLIMISSQNAANREDRTMISGLVQILRYLGASVGVTMLAGMLPDIKRITEASQFGGAFLLAIILCFAGLINEIL